VAFLPLLLLAPELEQLDLPILIVFDPALTNDVVGWLQLLPGRRAKIPLARPPPTMRLQNPSLRIQKHAERFGKCSTGWHAGLLSVRRADGLAP
jgi:hypothetical protein